MPLVKETEGDTQIFIYPGYKFKCIDSLITNFHLPESTLIMLVSAFMGREFTLEVYKHAVEEKYKDNMSEDEALKCSIDALIQYVEAGSKNMEVAVIKPGNQFEIVSDDKIEEIIKQVEASKKKNDKKN